MLQLSRSSVDRRRAALARLTRALADQYQEIGCPICGQWAPGVLPGGRCGECTTIIRQTVEALSAFYPDGDTVRVLLETYAGRHRLNENHISAVVDHFVTEVPEVVTEYDVPATVQLGGWSATGQRPATPAAWSA